MAAKRVRLTPQQRAERIRTFVEGAIARRGELPTIREITEAVGGSNSTIGELLREYRTPHTGRADERRVAAGLQGGDART